MAEKNKSEQKMIMEYKVWKDETDLIHLEMKIDQKTLMDVIPGLVNIITGKRNHNKYSEGPIFGAPFSD